jgi:quinolinate synthase
MAETAKIVNPTRRVLLPDMAAGCSLADSCPASKLAAAKAADPSLYVVAYINCSAAVKAISDVIVTSGNASKIVSRVPADRNILFVPDQNLGRWVSGKTGRAMQPPIPVPPSWPILNAPKPCARWPTWSARPK